MRKSPDNLVPPPPVVRDLLVRHNRQGRILKSLYQLSLRVAEERQRNASQERPEARQTCAS